MIAMSLIEAVNHPYSGFITLALVVAFALWANRVTVYLWELSGKLENSAGYTRELHFNAKEHFERWNDDLDRSLRKVSNTEKQGWTNEDVKYARHSLAGTYSELYSNLYRLDELEHLKELAEIKTILSNIYRRGAK